MAEIEFRVSTGPYAGDYRIDSADVNASDVGDLLAQGGPDLDAVLTGVAAKGLRMFAGLVWVVRRRGSSKALAYRAVADNLTFGMIEPLEDEKESAEKLADPSRSEDD